jgi:hypothetical protein
MLKLFRRLEPGLNPELEVGRFLNSHCFPHCQTVAGGLEYFGRADSRTTLAVVHAFIPSANNAWDFTLDALSRYYDRVITWVAQGQSAAVPLSEPVQLLQPDFPPKSRKPSALSSNRRGFWVFARPNCIGYWRPTPSIRRFAPEPSTRTIGARSFNPCAIWPCKTCGYCAGN